jgi:tetratricopeptide (TPR) repeat protein
MKLSGYLILLILLSFISYGNDYKTLLRQGDDFYKRFDLKQAALSYEEAYQLEKDNYEILIKLSRTYNDLGEDYYEIKENKNSEHAIIKALKYSELLLEKFPDSAMTYAYLAMSYGNLAMFKGGTEKVKLAHKIKENAEKSIKIDPNNYLPYIILSIYHRQIASLSWLERAFANTFFGKVPEGSFEESEKMMLKALELQPGICVAMFHLSRTYYEMDNEKKEIEWLKKIIEAPVTDFRDKYAKRKAREILKRSGN